MLFQAMPDAYLKLGLVTLFMDILLTAPSCDCGLHNLLCMLSLLSLTTNDAAICISGEAGSREERPPTN